MSSWDIFSEVSSILTEMGGKGSGHHGHKGIKGHRGGSAPSKVGGLSVRGVGSATPTDISYIEGVVDRVTTNLPSHHLKGFEVQVVRSSKLGKAGKVGQESSSIQIPRRDQSGKPLPRGELESLVRHEIGHQVFKRVLTSGQRQNWVEAGKQIRLGSRDPKVRRYFPWLDDASQMRVSPKLRDLSFGGELFAELYDGYYGYKKSAVKELFPARYKRLQALEQTTKSNFIIPQIESQLDLTPEGGWVERGGPGSGHWGHKGRKGKRGGSARGRAGGPVARATSRVVASRSTGGKLNKEWVSNFAKSHGDVSGPFENVVGEDNPRYYTHREEGKLVAGGTTTRTGLVTFIHSIASHSPRAGQTVLDEIKKDSIFVHTLAATTQGREFFERNGFIYDPHPGQYTHRWTRRAGAVKSDFIIPQIESALALTPEGGWVERGGPGSGHWGHRGRKGKRGGSARGRAGGLSHSIEGALSRYLFNEHRRKMAAGLDVQLNDALREYGRVAGSPITEIDVDRILVYGSFVDAGTDFPSDMDMVVQIKSQSPSVPNSKYGVNAKIWPQGEKSIPMLFTQNEGVFDAIKETVEAGVTGGPSVALQVYPLAPSETVKSDFIIPQIESTLGLSPEGGWVERGGPGSGHWGHRGRKGKRGGSARSGARGRAVYADPGDSRYLNSVLEGKVDTYVPPGRTDPIANEIIKEQGFDGKPDVVTSEELDKFVEGGERELVRGVSRMERAEELAYGDTFETGTGMHGAGLYTAYGETAEGTAQWFGAKGGENAVITRMSLKKDAKVVTESELKEDMLNWLAKREGIQVDPDALTAQAFAAYKRGDNTTADRLMKASFVAKEQGDVVGHVATGDRGRFAAARGYDAIDVPEQGYMVVLNRTALRVETPESSKLLKPVPAPTPRKTPVVLTPQQIKVGAITPGAKLPAHKVMWLRKRVEEKRQEAMAAGRKVAAAKSSGTVKKWHERRKSAEFDMHYLIGVLEGRFEAKSDFIIPQIESQLNLTPEGGWVERGGPGSGHWGHRGRKGKRGGSARSRAAAPSRGVLSPSSSPYSMTTFERENWDKLNSMYNEQAPMKGWKEATEKERAELKAQVARDLSGATRIPEEDCAEFVEQWAHSSNDDDMRSLAIQQDAAKEFGLKTSDFTQSKIDKVEADKRNLLPLAKEKLTKVTADPWLQQETARQMEAPYRPLMDSDKQRAILRSMYDKTQTDLREAGVKEVRLMRGVRLPIDSGISEQQGRNVPIEANSIESWSLSLYSASEFASRMSVSETYPGSAEMVGAVLQTTVPASRILSMPTTGFGCLKEGEVVVLGGEGDSAFVTEVYE